jgi:DNA-binding transcriptional ArsR family regulator
MNESILSLLQLGDMTALQIRRALKVRHETVYMALVRLEAAGQVALWSKDRPRQVLWCKAEAL